MAWECQGREGTSGPAPHWKSEEKEPMIDPAIRWACVDIMWSIPIIPSNGDFWYRWGRRFLEQLNAPLKKFSNGLSKGEIVITTCYFFFFLCTRRCESSTPDQLQSSYPLKTSTRFPVLRDNSSSITGGITSHQHGPPFAFQCCVGEESAWQ